MDLTCFGDNYIGIRYECNASTPTSGLYIDDLPGISLKVASMAADDETVTGVNLIRQLEQQAIREVWNDLQAKLTKYIQLNTIIDQRQIGLHRDDITIQYLPVQAANVGLQVEKSDCDPYTSIQVNYIDIRSNSTVAGKVLSIDDCGTVTNYTFDAVAGCVARIYTNYKAISGKLLITVDASDLELENLPLWNGCACVAKCGCQQYGCFNVDGWDGTKEVSTANGMTANISCICSPEPFLCSIQNQIAMGVQLRLGMLLMHEILTSSRCNFFIRNTKEQARELLLQWEGGINMSDGIEVKSRYWRLIGQTAEQIKGSIQNNGSACISCSGMTATETIP